jgi:cell division protein FtsA
MSKNSIIAGLDIGSANIRTIIAQNIPDEEIPRIIGVGIAPSSGARKGVVVDVEDMAKAIKESILAAEIMAGRKIENITASIGGTEIDFQESKGVVAIGKADGEVTESDISRVVDAAQTISIPPNREILHIIPRSYRLDDQTNIKDPLGMNGVRLEVDALVIEGFSGHIKNLNKSIEQNEIEVNNLILSPLASANAILNKKQKELGVALVDIGGATTSVAVFEEGDLIHLAILPIGANHITNDVAIGLRTSIETAEKIKLEYGCAFSNTVDKNEDIDLSQIDSQEEGEVSRYHVAEIIEARLEEIFDLVGRELKNIGKAGLLPAGIVLVGGGAKLPQIVEFAKDSLGLPAQIGYPIRLGGILDKVDDPSFAVAIGLILWAQEEVMREDSKSGKGMMNMKALGNFSSDFGSIADKVKKWLKKFLP